MPAATSVPIVDGQTVTHTFVPSVVSPQLTILRNTAASISAAEEQLGLSLSRATANRATNKVKITIALPHTWTDSNTGLVGVRDVFRFTGEFIIPDTMSEEERADASAIVRNALAVTAIKNYVNTLESYW